MAHKIMQMERQGYDAAIIGCAGDPGMDAMRELTTRMLVTGPGECSFHAAAMLGKRFALLTLDKGMVAAAHEQAFRAGVPERMVAVVSVDTPVLDLMKDPEATLQKLVDACKRVICEQQVDVIAIGCMTMGFLPSAARLESEIGIPVVNPANVCLKFTEALVSCRLMHSKAAFPLPPKLKAGLAGDYTELCQRRDLRGV
jgi:allantoin racemase